MAAPEEAVTVDAVCQFFVQNGGRATNKELVSHFRNSAFDQQQKGESFYASWPWFDGEFARERIRLSN